MSNAINNASVVTEALHMLLAGDVEPVELVGQRLERGTDQGLGILLSVPDPVLSQGRLSSL